MVPAEILPFFSPVDVLGTHGNATASALARFGLVVSVGQDRVDFAVALCDSDGLTSCTQGFTVEPPAVLAAADNRHGSVRKGGTLAHESSLSSALRLNAQNDRNWSVSHSFRSFCAFRRSALGLSK